MAQATSKAIEATAASLGERKRDRDQAWLAGLGLVAAGLAACMLVVELKRRKQQRRRKESEILDQDGLELLHKLRCTGTFEEDWIVRDKLGVVELTGGVYARVFACESKHAPGLHAVLKVVSMQLLQKAQGLREQLEDELAVVQRLHHPHVLRLYGAFRTDADLLYVQEKCEGGELFDRLVDKQHYSEVDARRLIKRMLCAIAYAHSQGIVHRDIKPENILLKSKDNDIDIKISDWGMAYELHGYEGVKSVCGTVAYMAPEVLDLAVLDSDTGYTEKADVWSIGVIAYMLLSGRHPFVADSRNTHKMVAEIRKCELTFPSESFEHVSEHAKDLCRSMLVRDPRKRLTARACLEHMWFHPQTHVHTHKKRRPSFHLVQEVPDVDAEINNAAENRGNKEERKKKKQAQDKQQVNNAPPPTGESEGVNACSVHKGTKLLHTDSSEVTNRSPYDDEQQEEEEEEGPEVVPAADLGSDLRRSISVIQEEKRRRTFKAAAQAVIASNRLGRSRAAFANQRSPKTPNSTQ